MNQAKNENLKINLIFNFMNQVIIMLSPLIVTPKISRVFGLDYIGIKSYTFSIVYYFAIFGVLGLDMLGQRKIALVKDDIIERSSIFWTIYVTRFILVLFSSILYIGYSLLANLTNVEQLVTFCWLIYLLREMINPIWFLQGLEKFRLLSVLGIISQLGYIICTVAFVNEKSDLPLYIVFYTAIPLFISICYFPTVCKHLILVKPKLHEMVLSLQESVVYFIPTIATAIYSMIDKTMLGIFDPQKVSTGLYESSERLVKVALAMSTASFTIMRNRMTYLFGRKDREAYQRMSLIFMSFSLMICWPIMFGIIGISKDFVPVFFGKGFEEVIKLSNIFSFVVPCMTVSGLLQAIYIFPYGLQKTMDFYYGIIAGVNIVMNLILIHFWGTTGAIIASIFAEWLLAIILIVKARKDIDVLFLAKGSINYLIASIVMVFVIRLFSSIFTINIIVKLVMELFCGVLVYLTTCFLLRDSFIIAQSQLLIKRLFNRNCK